MADFPTVGASEDSWGDELVAFLERSFVMSGDYGGLYAGVCNENQLVINQNEILVNVPGT